MISPSKTGFLFLVPLISMVLVAGLFVSYRDTSTVTQEPAHLATAESTTEAVLLAATDTDTDGDGLPDWEEQLWGTNVRVQDSDGDGLSDGFEVRNKRDPSVSGDDTLALADEGQTTLATTATAILGRELLGTYLELRDTQEFGPEMQKEILERAMAQAKVAAEPTSYSIEDLTVVQAADNDTLALYAQSVMSAMSFEATSMDIVLLSNFITAGDERARTQLEALLVQYRASIELLSSMPVPESYVDLHLLLLNGFSATTNDFTLMLNVREDPTGALVAANRFSYDVHMTTNAIVELRNRFQAEQLMV